MPVPQIFGIGSQIQPAIEQAKMIAINIEREIRFAGKRLCLFEMTPSGEVETLSLTEDWVARRLKRTSNKPDESLWVIEIQKGIPEAFTIATGSLIKIGKLEDWIVFKITKVERPEGNLGAWFLIAELVTYA